MSKNYWWKNTLSLSKVLVCYEIETFTTWSPLEVWRWHNFSISVDNIKNRFVDVSTISHHPQTAWKVSSVKGQQRWKNLITIISSWKYVHVSKNPLFRKIVVYYKIHSEAATKIFRKILSNVRSWRSTMTLKKTLIKGIFLWFS